MSTGSTPPSAKEQSIAGFLTGVNYISGENLWTADEISDVSNKITTDLFGNFNDILDIGIGRPLGRKSAKPIQLSYYNNTKEYDTSTNNDYKLIGRPEVNTISFESEPIDSNPEQGYNNLYYKEAIHILNVSKDHNDANNSLRAYAIYDVDSNSRISSSEHAWYLVCGANGIFRGAKRVKIVFNKDRTRNVSVHFD